MINNKIIGSGILVAIVLAGVVPLVSAQAPLPDESTTGASVSDTAPGQAVKEKVCDRVKQKIENRIQQFDQKKRSHVMAYNNLQERIKKFIEKLKEKGYDTAKLNRDLETLNNQVIKFATDYTKYINKLKEAGPLTCGDAGVLKAKIAEARELLKTVHEDAQAIREYYRSTIKQDIKDLKKK